MRRNCCRAGVVILASLLLLGCGGPPDKAYEHVRDTLDRHIAPANAKVGKISFGNRTEKGEWHFEAQVVDAAGNTLGSVEGRWIEGLGTIYPSKIPFLDLPEE